MQISQPLQILVGFLVGIGAYFIGNINSAVMLSKMKGRDIRTCGSGNPGTMNMIRTFGKVYGALTLIFDVLKGVIPALLGWLFMGDGQFLELGSNRLGLYIGGLCVEIGHIYPVLMKFKGGKGIATVFGVCLLSQPLPMLVSFGLGVIFLIVTKIGSLTSFMMLCSSMTFEGYFASVAPEGIWTSVLTFGGYHAESNVIVSVVCAVLIFAMFALTLFAHRKNLYKLFAGNEGRVILKKPKVKKPDPDTSICFDSRLVAE